MKKKNRSGDPHTPAERKAVYESLKPFLQLGYSVRKACILAQFPYTTLCEWLKKSDSSRMQLAYWKATPSIAARQNIVKDIVEKKDVKSSQWWLETNESKEFNRKINVQEVDDDFIPEGDIEYEDTEFKEILKRNRLI